MDPTEWAPVIGRLSARHHVVAVQTVDPRELELPAVGMLGLVDPESGRVLHVQTNSERLRTRDREAALDRHTGIARSIRSAGADHLLLFTARDWLVDIARSLSYSLAGSDPPELVIQGGPPASALHTSEVEAVVSAVARHPTVREVMRQAQRA